MCAANLMTSWAFKIKLMNGMAPRYTANAIPGLSRFLCRAELYKNFKLVKTASNNNLIRKNGYNVTFYLKAIPLLVITVMCDISRSRKKNILTPG